MLSAQNGFKSRRWRVKKYYQGLKEYKQNPEFVANSNNLVIKVSWLKTEGCILIFILFFIGLVMCTGL